MHKPAKILSALALAGVVSAGGSAFTASNTLNGDNIAGYGSDTVSGANTSGIDHTLSTDGTKIESTELTFTALLPSGATVKAGFDGDLVSCTVDADDRHNAACDYGDADPDTEDATDFQVAVS
jgi:hypothetical protein